MRITDGAEPDSEEVLRTNIEQLMELFGWNQTVLAQRLGKDQSWVSRHLSRHPPPKGARFQFPDLDLLADVFGVSPAQLLQPRYGKWDRRSGHDRRSGIDRRQQASNFHPHEFPKHPANGDTDIA